MKSKALKIVGMSLILGLSNGAFADNFFRVGKVVRVFSSSVNFGGCMIQLTQPIGEGCPNNGWVSLDCTGGFYPVADAKMKYSLALTALAVDKDIVATIDPTKMHNGYCVAERIDVYSAPL